VQKTAPLYFCTPETIFDLLNFDGESMSKTTPINPADLRGISRLTIDAVTGLTKVVEAMHRNIACFPGFSGKATQKSMNGITGFVYRNIRRITNITGNVIDAALVRVIPMMSENASSPVRESLLAALNGVLGDYMTDSENPLTIFMQMRQNGQALKLERQALTDTIRQPATKLAIMVHGLCMNDLQWNRNGHDHGYAIARDMGYSTVYLHYNTGLHISANGRSFADLVENLVKEWPVPLEELVIISHSMGGLVSRSACFYGERAGHNWLGHLKKIIFLGTPHHGAPTERGGNHIDFILGISPYSAPLARLGKIRSSGITDLRYGSLADEDWEGRDRFKRCGDMRIPIPLPERAMSYTIAATVGKKRDDIRNILPGDGLVPIDSALGRHKKPDFDLSFPESRQWIAYGINHFELLNHPEVYEKIKEFLQ